MVLLRSYGFMGFMGMEVGYGGMGTEVYCGLWEVFVYKLNHQVIFFSTISMRKARVIQAGATYHIVAKANRGEFIFNSDEMKEMFLSIMETAKKKYDFKLIHYCIMSNHVHLIVTPGPGSSLSALMRWILAVFARRFNIIHGIHGHVWYDRFKSKIIRSYKHFVNVFQYISNNPVKAGICENARTYAYGGLYELHKNHYRLLEPVDYWLNMVPV